jgi:hypothetical protein
LNILDSSPINKRVNRLKPFVAFMVLALWASCAVRCELASLASTEDTACCGGPAGQSSETPTPANQCLCSWALSGGYISEKTSVPLPLLVGLPLFNLATEMEAPKSDAAASVLIFSSPELLTSWQFSFRAALSPRAPSFVS